MTLFVAQGRTHEDSFKVGIFDRGIILDCHHVYYSFFTPYIKGDVVMIINHKIEVWPNMDNETIVDKLHDFVAIWQEECKEEIKELASANLPFQYGYACGKLDIVEKLEGFLSDTGEY